MVEEKKKRATAGFIVSLIAAILILLNAIFVSAIIGIIGAVGFKELMPIVAGGLIIYTVVGVIFAVLVLIGAILIYIPGKEVVGGILVIIFSLLSVITGGGFLIGLILGIIGGALGLAKK